LSVGTNLATAAHRVRAGAPLAFCLMHTLAEDNDHTEERRSHAEKKFSESHTSGIDSAKTAPDSVDQEGNVIV